MTDFPLTKSLGLELHAGHHNSPESPGYTAYVRASDLEAVLEKGVRIAIEKHHLFGWSGQEHDDGEWFDEATHSAMLIDITPIVKDTAESLLGELVKCWKLGGSGHYVDTAAVVDRAKKVLEGK